VVALGVGAARGGDLVERAEDLAERSAARRGRAAVALLQHEPRDVAQVADGHRSLAELLARHAGHGGQRLPHRRAAHARRPLVVPREGKPREEARGYRKRVVRQGGEVCLERGALLEPLGGGSHLVGGVAPALERVGGRAIGLCNDTVCGRSVGGGGRGGKRVGHAGASARAIPLGPGVGHATLRRYAASGDGVGGTAGDGVFGDGVGGPAGSVASARAPAARYQ
jgi:hypothetical protein